VNKVKPKQVNVEQLQEQVQELSDFVNTICSFHRQNTISDDLEGFVAWVLIRAATLQARKFMKAGTFDC
jgi:hypothetical protein